MLLLRKSNRRASSRRQINLRGVQDGILMLPRHEYRAILSVSSINFELKSEEEQDALIETYEGVLNSLGCPVQIVIRIRELDMDKYLRDLEGRLSGETEEVYRSQLHNYTAFIHSLVRNNKILTRHFYVVVPLRVGSDSFELVKEQLGLSCDIVTKGLARLGMQSRRLGSLEVLDLFYSFYNPGLAKRQPIAAQALQLLYTVFVQKESGV